MLGRRASNETNIQCNSRRKSVALFHQLSNQNLKNKIEKNQRNRYSFKAWVVFVCEGESGEDENHDDLNQQQTIKNGYSLLTFEDPPFGFRASYVTCADSFCLDTTVEGIELRHC